MHDQVRPHESVCLRRVAPRRSESGRGERVQAPQARRRNTPGAKDPRGGPLLQDAAYPHGDHVGHHPASASGGKLRPRRAVVSPPATQTRFFLPPLFAAGRPHRSEGSPRGHVQISRRRRAERQHDGQRGARRSSPHR